MPVEIRKALVKKVTTLALMLEAASHWGVNDGERADLANKGAAGKRLTYRQPH
jgi:hypothetical protein